MVPIVNSVLFSGSKFQSIDGFSPSLPANSRFLSVNFFLGRFTGGKRKPQSDKRLLTGKNVTKKAVLTKLRQLFPVI